MLSRALTLATVMLLLGWFAENPAHAQATNLEAGKSPSQIFAGTCTACHKSPRGLLKSVPAGSLPGFLRQHYTTSPDMAGLLSSFLISNGASDSRYGGGQGKPDKDARSDPRYDPRSDAKSDGKPGGQPQQLDRQGRPIHPATSSREPARPEAEPRQSAKPEADGISPQDEGGRKGRKRLARPTEEGAKPESEAGEPGSEGRKPSAKQRLGRRGRPGEEIKELPKADAAKGDAVKGDAAKTDTGKDEPAAATATREDKPAGETVKDEKAKPSDDSKSETAKIDSSKDTAPKAPVGQAPSMRTDPVPSVTPAPSPATSSGTQEPVAGAAKPAAPSPPPTAQSAASEPAPTSAPAVAPSPAAPAGPPEPPISR